jgi:glyoxylase-like metal-dependent hydrolase (beta-lactamase superfamily II)
MSSPPAVPLGLQLELLPARQGDAILLTWGPADDRHRMLVDGGPAPAYPDISQHLGQLPAKALDVVVLTHIDGDHIEGTILLANDKDLDLSVGEIWFNGSHHLVSELGPVHGEILGARFPGTNPSATQRSIPAPGAGCPRWSYLEGRVPRSWLPAGRNCGD